MIAYDWAHAVEGVIVTDKCVELGLFEIFDGAGVSNVPS